LDEKHLIELSENDPIPLIKQTTWRILRSYPGGIRQDSSNPDPVLSWNVGVQMAAVNYQNSDDQMALYYGKFLDNGGCGYVLKPDYLRNAHQTEFNPHHSLNSFDQHLIFQITVISGQFLPRSNLKTTDIPDPYVQITAHGLPCDDKVYKTRTIDNNGFDPYWNETFEFRIKFPQMCLLYFSVIDYDPMSKDDRMAYFCAPVTMIQPGNRQQSQILKIILFLFLGFRHIHLKDNKNDSTYATLFVFVDIRKEDANSDAILYTRV
jgi:phosphatidylinositol phospholipase C delta